MTTMGSILRIVSYRAISVGSYNFSSLHGFIEFVKEEYLVKILSLAKQLLKEVVL